MDNKGSIKVIATANKLEEIIKEIPLLEGAGFEGHVGFQIDYNTLRKGEDMRPIAYIALGDGESRPSFTLPNNVSGSLFRKDGILSFHTEKYEYWVRPVND